MNNINRRKPLRPFYLFLALLFITMLFWGGHQPGAVGLFPPPYDKAAHFVAFGALSLFLSLGLNGRWPVSVIVFVAAVAALDEWLQSFNPGRMASFGDFSADVLAAVVVVTTFFLLKKRFATL